VPGDFQVKPGSDAIDSGRGLGLDYDYNRVPVGTPDIGAFELECAHESDNDPCDGEVSIAELIAYMSLWKSGSVTIQDIMQAIIAWKG
jgi:hypothetical protein